MDRNLVISSHELGWTSPNTEEPTAVRHNGHPYLDITPAEQRTSDSKANGLRSYEVEAY